LFSNFDEKKRRFVLHIEVNNNFFGELATYYTNKTDTKKSFGTIKTKNAVFSVKNIFFVAYFFVIGTSKLTRYNFFFIL